MEQNFNFKQSVSKIQFWIDLFRLILRDFKSSARH